MRTQYARKLLWLVAALAAIPSAFAALPELFEPIIDLIGQGGLSQVYFMAPLLWDSIFALVFFISLVGKVLGERFGKAVSTVLGIMLAIGFAVMEQMTGFSLVALGPLAFFILLLVIGTAVYELIAPRLQNKLVAFAAAYITMWAITMVVGKIVFGEHVSPTLWGILNALFGIFIFYLLIKGVVVLFDGFRKQVGGSAGGSGSGSAERATGPGFFASTLGAMGDAAERRREAAKVRAEAGTTAAKETAGVVQKALEDELAKQLKATLDKRAWETTIKESVEQTTAFVDNISAYTNAARSQPGFNSAAYSAEIAKYKAGLAPFFAQQQQIINDLKRIYGEDAKRRETQWEKQYLDAIGSSAVGKYAHETELAKKLAATEAGIASRMDIIVELEKEAASEGVTDMQPTAKELLGEHATAHQNHREHVKQLQQEYASLQAAAKQMSDERKALEMVFVAKRKLTENRLENATQLEQNVRNHQQRVLEFIDTLGDPEIVKHAAATVYAMVAEYEKHTTQFLGFVNEAEQHVENIKKIEATQGALATDFDKRLEEVFAEDEKLLALDIAATQAVKACIAAHVTEPAQYYAPSRYNTRISFDFMKKTKEANLELAKKMVENSAAFRTIQKQLRDEQARIEKLVGKDDPAYAAISKAIIVEGLVRADLIDKWDKYVAEQMTASAKAMKGTV